MQGDKMIEYVHKHITSELQQNTRTDTIFIITSIILNLMALAINSATAEGSRDNTDLFIVMFIIVALVLVVNTIVIVGLVKGKQTRDKLTKGLIKMYEDENVSGYYDKSLLTNYNTRYNLFMLTVVFIGAIAIAIPFIMR